jgi:hypothetical protein
MNLTQKQQILDLTAKLPKSKESIYTILAKRLNQAGKRTKMGKEYGYSVLSNVFAGKTDDNQVVQELYLMVAESQGKEKEMLKVFQKANAILA